MFWTELKIMLRRESVDLLGGKEDLKLLHLSDLHLWFSTGLLKYLAEVIKNSDPELLVLTGDYYDVPAGARNFRKFLFQVSRERPVVFIRGNHDKLYGPRVSGLLFGIPNCHCVEDSVFKFTSGNGHGYHISSWASKHLLPSDNSGINIVLIHDPERIKERELENIHLIFAGHLHGGQFILGRARDRSHFPANLLYRHCTDRKQLGHTHLIVSRGLGDTFPFRYNCPKEVVLVQVN